MRKKPQLPHVSCKYGAPMGRPHWMEGTDKPARCFRVRFVDGDYDEGGAYWGSSPPALYCATNVDLANDVGEGGFCLFVRTDSRAEAKNLFQKEAQQKGMVIRWKN